MFSLLNGHVVNYGQHRTRRSFSRIKEILPLPNLTDVQTESYKWFLDEGVKEVFDDILPISDASGRLTLEYVDYKLQEPKYTVDESRKHDATYSAPMHVTLKLTNHETGEIKTQDVFRRLALMTKSGSFIVNGRKELSFPSWLDHLVSTTVANSTRTAGKSSARLSSLTVGLGWNSKLMPRTFPTSVLTGPGSFLYLSWSGPWALALTAKSRKSSATATLWT